MKSFMGKIYITNHAKDRFRERRINITSNRNKEVNIYKKMLEMIKRSRLIKYLKKEDGRIHEYREYAGCIFVCHREFSKDIFKPDLVTVITVEMTDKEIISSIDRGYNMESLCLNSYKSNQINSILN